MSRESREIRERMNETRGVGYSNLNFAELATEYTNVY